MSEEFESFPSTVGLETINTCNARCVFCPLFQGEYQLDRQIRPATILDQKMYEAFLEEIAGWAEQPRSFFLNMDGEPLQDPLFCERMTAIAKYGFGPRATLQTNGQLLDEKKARAILDAKINNVVFGFDGATKETYEKHRVRCDYDRVLANIKMFVQLRDEQQSATKIEIKFVRTRRNAHEVRDAYKMFNAFLSVKQDYLMDMLAIDWSNAEQTEQSDLYYTPKIVGGTPVSGCELLEKQMIVLSDGKLAACCFDYNLDVSGGGYPLEGGSLLAAWHNEKRHGLIKRLLSTETDKKPPKCRNCPAHYKFKLRDAQPPAIPEALMNEHDMGFNYRFGVEID